MVRRLSAILAFALAMGAVPAAWAHQAAPRDVIASYYRLIDRRDYHAAFRLWSIGEDGRNGAGQSEAQFAAGFRQTRNVRVSIVRVGEAEGAAGSQYVSLQVRVRARTSTGRDQAFAGEYTLRRSVVEGGDPHWKIYSAKLEQVHR